MVLEEITFAVGSIVWVKLTGGKWWPGEVVDPNTCPTEVTKGLKKNPLAIVKYFDEDFYELVKNENHIQPFLCSRRKDFTRKGREILKSDPHLDKFVKDVAEAERLCGAVYDISSSDDIDMAPPGNHASNRNFPKLEHNHGSALVSSMLSSVKDPDSSFHIESSYELINDIGNTPKDVRIRKQPTPLSHITNSCGRSGAYSCDVCGFQTSRIANIIIHHKSHTDLHLHHWPPMHGSSQDLFKKSETVSEGKLQRHKSSLSESMQKIKRRLLVSDKKPSKKKTNPLKRSDSKGKLLCGVNRLCDGRETPAKKNKIANEKESKKKTKKGDDNDAVFEKIKKLGMKKMNVKRGRSSYLGLGPSPSLMKTFKRDGCSDESSDEGEFLIMREDINTKEDDEDKIVQDDDNERTDSQLMDKVMDDVSVDSPQHATRNDGHKASSGDNVKSMEMDEFQGSSNSGVHNEEILRHEGENALSKSTTIRQFEYYSKDETIDKGSAQLLDIGCVKDDSFDVLMNGSGNNASEKRDAMLEISSIDHSYDKNKILNERDLEGCIGKVVRNDHRYEPVTIMVSESFQSPTELNMPPVHPPLPPTPPPPPPPPSPPVNDYSSDVIIDPGDIPLPPFEAPKFQGKEVTQQQNRMIVLEEPPLEYTKLETLVQPPEFSVVSSSDAYEVLVEGPTIVESDDIIQIGNEQVIDTSMDVFCNEVVIESDDKIGEAVIEYGNIGLMSEDKSKHSYSATAPPKITGGNGSLQLEAITLQNQVNESE